MKEPVQFINKENLRIARENMGLNTVAASSQISVSKKDIVLEWEEGKSLPTWSQVKKLSKAYNVPELVFFSNEKIQKNKAIPDYRVGVDQDDDRKVKKLVNLIIARQRWLERYFQEENLPKNSLQGSGKDIKTPKALADFISKKLNINLEEVKGFSGIGAQKKALNYFLRKAEDHNVFTGKTISYHDIKVKDMRGLFISNDYCPFIVINRKDAVAAQIFSFVHELAHLFRKSDAVSNSLDFRTTNNEANSEEIFCNKVAAELLLPAIEFKSEFYDKEGIDKIAELYKVSKLFIFYRLKDLRKIPRDIQDNLERDIKAETAQNVARAEEERKKKKKGGDYINAMRDSNGALFNHLVASLYSENRIGYVEAANLLRFSPEKV